jgi:hypothetical protein
VTVVIDMSGLVTDELDPVTLTVAVAIGPSKEVKLDAVVANELIVVPEPSADDGELAEFVVAGEVDRNVVLDGRTCAGEDGPEALSMLDGCVDDKLMEADVETEEALELDEVDKARETDELLSTVDRLDPEVKDATELDSNADDAIDEEGWLLADGPLGSCCPTGQVC